MEMVLYALTCTFFFIVKGLFLFPENLRLVLGIIRQCWLLPAQDLSCPFKMYVFSFKFN